MFKKHHTRTVAGYGLACVACIGLGLGMKAMGQDVAAGAAVLAFIPWCILLVCELRVGRA